MGSRPHRRRPAKPDPPIQHTNPDYYAETASIFENPKPVLPPRPQGQSDPSYATQSPPPLYSYQQQHGQPPLQQPPLQQQQQQQQPPSPARIGPNGTNSFAYGENPSASSAQTVDQASDKPTMRERLYQMSVKAGAPINRLTNKLGSEAFWPSSLDLECDKAARILKSFCHDGFYTTAPSGKGSAYSPSPKGGPSKALVKIPQQVIQSAAGLAIFTTFRTGLHISGAGGSGIIVARLPDGRWSPPSGFLVHTLGAGLLVGFDVYDCVCILRTPQAVRMFTAPRVSLGGEVGLAAGPLGGGGSVEAALRSRTSATTLVWSYIKSRGFYAGLQADGTIIVGRPDANAAFYGQRGITVDQILRGEVTLPPRVGTSSNSSDAAKPWPVATRQLMEVLKDAEGRKDVDNAMLHELDSGLTPGDMGFGKERRGHSPG